MKKIVLLVLPILFTTLISSSAFGQEADTTEYKASMSGWEVELTKAFEKSQATGLPILANFTGTDWCGWCIRLKSSVFTTDTFKDWAAENVILLEVDFPRKFRLPTAIAQQNSGLQQAFGVSGYPTIWVFDVLVNEETGQTSLQALAKTGYAPEVNAWIADLESKIAASRKSIEEQQGK